MSATRQTRSRHFGPTSDLSIPFDGHFDILNPIIDLSLSLSIPFNLLCPL